MTRYNPKDFETKWQNIWDETGVYTADLDTKKPKYMAMSMFNYPSGNLHIGHAMNFTISDVKARFKRQQGYESYHPVGWDAFGLPAENRAIKEGMSPQESMAQLIPDYHKGYKAMGWSNDWEKEISTHLPEYYKWTQWIFSEMYRNGLAYQEERQQWWCDQCQTVLANEQVIDGKCWRHDGADDPLVEKRGVKQWFFKITDYADELLVATDALDWTESVKLAQKNWIGRSEGAEIEFAIDGSDQTIKVFTTRPDTIFGATFMVIAPESELVEQLVADEHRPEVEAYQKEAAAKTEVERAAAKDKTGVFTGSYAVNPANDEKVPIWVADYVLGGYGTGAIMAVPAHDERDYEFAVEYDLTVRPVIGTEISPPASSIPRDGVETIYRETVDAIIKNTNGDVLLQKEIEAKDGKEIEHVHFVGGGIENGETAEEALVREVLEETGYTDVASVRQVGVSYVVTGYRHTKGKNQAAATSFFEVVLASDKKVASESDTDKHTVEWVSSEAVSSRINWPHHLLGWEHYQANDSVLFVGSGVTINSDGFNWLKTDEAKEKITDWLIEKGVAERKVNYKMRDWSVSRQRYWGAPIPIVYCEKDGAVLVADEQLPVVLPELDDFQPSGDGRSALARAKDWLQTTCPECGGNAERETDTLDTYICSSWYMYRYMDPHNQQAIFDTEKVKKWEPIDFYNGGDHATAHLLYARFIGHFFKKLGLVSEPEPFKQFLFNGKVRASDGSAFSKSKGNGLDPLEIIGQGYGADALRTYLMFAAPLEFNSRWDTNGVPGSFRFLNRLWNLVQEFNEAEAGDTSESQAKTLGRTTHKMIQKMTEDVEGNRYNTAIAASMENVNELYKCKAENLAQSTAWREALEGAVACVAPFAPHTSEELWHQLGHSNSVHRDTWPELDESKLGTDTITLAVQVNGKVRAEIEAASDADKDTIIEMALSHEKISGMLAGKKPTKTIYVPGRLVNIVL